MKRKYKDNPHFKVGDIAVLNNSLLESYQKEKGRFIYQFIEDRKLRQNPIEIEIVKIHPYKPGQGYTLYDIRIIERDYIFFRICSYVIRPHLMQMLSLLEKEINC